MVKIARCNIVYTHDSSAVGIGVGNTPQKAQQAATQAAYANADAFGSAWVNAEVKNAVCPAACPGNPDYVVVRRGNARLLAIVPVAFRAGRVILWQAFVLQGWRAEYWCGKRPFPKRVARSR
jgi:hypothetical protein